MKVRKPTKEFCCRHCKKIFVGNSKGRSEKNSGGRFCHECAGGTPKERKGIAYQRLVKYGMTNSEYISLVEKQGGVCAVCMNPPIGKRSTAILHVDHDHITGLVRGLLCHHCNVALSKIEDREWHARALMYLSRNENQSATLLPCETRGFD